MSSASKSPLKQLRKPGAEGSKSFKPQLTSLVDVMTILLIYLLKSFSSKANSNRTKDLQLLNHRPRNDLN